MPFAPRVRGASRSRLLPLLLPLLCSTLELKLMLTVLSFRRLAQSILIIAGTFLFTTASFAGSVHSCKTSYQRVGNTQDIRKVTRCVLDLSEGGVGDVVEIKNQYNYIIATGSIVSKKGRHTIVVLKDIFKQVKSGYPVIVRNNDSIDHWTATTAPY